MVLISDNHLRRIQAEFSVVIGNLLLTQHFHAEISKRYIHLHIFRSLEAVLQIVQRFLILPFLCQLSDLGVRYSFREVSFCVFSG